MEEKDKTYTATDFARYHAGTMPVAEMYALEKAALEDPFLADALEGYAYSESPEKDITDLQELLAEKRKKKKVFSIASLSENKWWRIAALFIIILGVSYLFYTNNNNKALNDLAKNNIEESPAKVETPSPVLKDLDSGKNDIAFEDKRSGVAKKTTSALPKINTGMEREKISAQSPAKNKEDATSLMMAKTNVLADSLAQPKPIKKDSTERYVFKGKVTDDAGAPIPNVSISISKKPEATITNTDGSFSFVSADSSVKVLASGVGFSNKTFLLKKDISSNIRLQRSTSSLEEVVITTVASKQKKAISSPSKILEEKADGIATNKLPLQPFPVSDKFNKYLQKKLVPVYNENNEQVNGEVVLAFSITKKGRPVNITVLKSTCEECEEQAIELLENGPDWKGANNITGSVEIKF